MTGIAVLQGIRERETRKGGAAARRETVSAAVNLCAFLLKLIFQSNNVPHAG